MAFIEREGFGGTAGSAESPTFAQRGVRDRPDRDPTLESTGAVDDRLAVPDPQNLPWRMVCALTISGQVGGRMPGTGFLAGPRTVVTAGHCVFDPTTLQGSAKTIVVTPGLNGSAQPFGQVKATRFRTLKQWIETADPDFDIGAITLDSDLGRLAGFFTTAALDGADLQSRLAHVSGYPESPGGGLQQFHHRNRIVTATERRLFYETDTSEGQSGAPVWILETDGGTPKVVGVHTYGFEKSPPGLPPSNSATLINAEILAQIAEWVQADSV